MFAEEDRFFMLHLVRELPAALRIQPKPLEKRLLSIEELATYMATRLRLLGITYHAELGRYRHESIPVLGFASTRN